MMHSMRYSWAMASLQLTTCSRMPGRTRRLQSVASLNSSKYRCCDYLNMATSTISSCDSLTKLVPTRILSSILSFSLLSLSRE